MSDAESIFDKQIAANVAEWRARLKTQRRSVTEWKGKSADSMPGDIVRERIREIWGDRCYLSGIEFRGKGFVVEHLVRIKDGGLAANREGNLRPVLPDGAIKKTAREKKDQSLADRKKRAGAGTKAKPKNKIKTRPAEVAEEQKKASKPPEKGSKLAEISALPRRSMFR